MRTSAVYPFAARSSYGACSPLLRLLISTAPQLLPTRNLKDEMPRVKKKVGSSEGLSVVAKPSKALGFALFFSENGLLFSISYRLETTTSLPDDTSSKTNQAQALSMFGKCPAGFRASMPARYRPRLSSRENSTVELVTQRRKCLR